MEIKSSVKVGGIQPEAIIALIVAESVYREFDVPFVWTSGLDSHEDRPNSLHLKGLAVDLRTRNFPDPVIAKKAANLIRSRLPDDYDVVLESNHIHVEFDPK